MRQLLYAFIFLFSISIVSCSDSGTGPNNNGDDNSEETTTYSVAVDVSPSEAGSISPSAEDSYEEGEEIELQADANDEYLFTHWSGDIDSTSDNPLSLTVDQDYNLTANFELKTYELSINTVGEGSVSEEVLEQKSKDYEHGTVVELTANPGEGWKFVEWQGDITGTNNPAQITVDDPKSVTAVFEKKSFALTINTSGNGSVSKNPDQTEYEFGTTVDLTANPDAGWSFDNWDGDTTSTENPITVQMDSAVTVTAIFSNDTFAGGNGTKTYPFEISAPEQLQAIKDYKNANFVVINDIDATQTSEWFSGKGFEPVGTSSDGFRGSLNGNGYSISNLYIDRPNTDNVALIAFASDTAIIKNLSLLSVSITGRDNVGSYISRSSNGINLIENCLSTGELSGKDNIGGLISNGAIQIINSSTNINIQGDNRIGGIMGSASFLLIKDSYSKGKISGFGTLGGLLAVNRQESGEIRNSYSEANIIGSSKVVGGLVGRNHGIITDSYAIGDVEGTDNIGGLIGENVLGSSVKNSYATSKVTAKNIASNLLQGFYVGGLIGYNEGYIEKSSAHGNVFSEANEIAGLVGRNTGTIIESYAEGNVTTIGSIAGGLTANNQGEVKSSYSSSNIDSVYESAGGLAGINSGIISNSYSAGNVNGETNIGGLVGTVTSNGEIEYTYQSGIVKGLNNTGALIGKNEGVSNILGSYWNIDTSGQTEGVGFGNDSGVNGLSDSDMTGSSAETNLSAFDFVNIWITTSSYPDLFWE